MYKRYIITFITLGAVLLAAAVYILYVKKPDAGELNRPLESMKAFSTAESQTVKGETGTKKSAENPVEIIKNENITVRNNSPEYDLKVTLYENSLNETYLKFEYYREGISALKEFGSEQIPELKEIFENREKESAGGKGCRVKTLVLNAKNTRACFIIEGTVYKNEVESAVYSYNLKDYSLKKLFKGKGISTGLFFTRDFKYMAFSYAGAENKGYPFLQVLKCSTDELVVNKNRDSKGILIGNNRDENMKYSYSFLSWYSSSIAKLKEIMYAKNANGSSGSEKQKEVLYDVVKNSFVSLNQDGSGTTNSTNASQNSTNTSKQDGRQNKAESDPVKTLKSFYAYLASDNEYGKALDLLDEEFKLKLIMLQQFGVSELGKSDIDLNNYSTYKDILKMARLGSIVEEKVIENTSTVYFYQYFLTGGVEQSKEAGEQIVQPMAATLEKTGTGWKITSLGDGNF